MTAFTEAVSAQEGRAFARRLEAATNAVERREDDAVGELQRLVKELRAAIADEIAEATGERVRSLQGLLGGIDRAAADFASRGSLALADAERDVWGLSVEALPQAVRAAGLDVLLPGVSVEQLAVLTGYSTDLIQGLAADVRAKVAPVIRQAAAGLLSPRDAMKRIGSTVGKGAFKAASARAEAIVRTEVLRTYSIATDARFAQAEEAGVQIQRKWNATNDARTRPDHRIAHGQIRGKDGFYRVGGERLRYPRDPRANASQTVRCRCVETADVIGVKA